MIEIVFGESACGSLKIAQTYGKGKYRGSAVSVFMRHEDGSVPSSDEMKEAQIQAQEQEHIAWENAIPLGGKSSDVYCFDMALSVGDISDNGIGEQRKNVLKKMLSVWFVEDLDYQVEEKIQKIKTTLSSVIERYVAGEEVRIWYSYNPDELCGMYWLMKQLRPLNCQTTIYLVKLPAWEYGKENTMTSKIAWGEVSPGEWGKYITLQEKAKPVFLSACAMKWNQLQNENAPLRAMLNGKLQSVSEDIYDSFILREIAEQPEQFKMAIVIGNVLGKYQLGISDVWISNRIDKMLEDGVLEIIQDAPKGETNYRRILRKRMYCPSVETKIVRFKDKERHQIFLEPEGADTSEIYVQGMSTSMPHDIQRQMYASVAGLEHADIVRYGYAIEYDCIDTLDVLPTLEFKKVSGVYTAGQINGTSGYEEAAAQGLIAGLNASLKLRGKPPLVLRRDQAYIGVLIDDLVTKGTDEPYRMMTSRAEYRVCLRQDDSDFRLTPLGYECGLVSEERYRKYLRRKQTYEKALTLLDKKIEREKCLDLLQKHGYEPPHCALSFADLIRRNVSLSEIFEEYAEDLPEEAKELPSDVLESAEISVKYGGYVKQAEEQIARAKKLEEKSLPANIDYSSIEGLRLEAREKLNRVRPLNLGQAGRISGVNPADIAVLMVYLSR